jgi:hypothetical protein
MTCFGGCYYDAKDNDTCESIASQFGVSTDRFLYQNGFDWNCSHIAVNQTLCVGSACALYTVTFSLPKHTLA